jgi:hypothetical protein
LSTDKSADGRGFAVGFGGAYGTILGFIGGTLYGAGNGNVRTYRFDDKTEDPPKKE